MSEARGDVTRLLGELQASRPGARDQLASLVYEEMHAIAQRLMRRERPDHTLQATALVNEALMRLLGGRQDWEGRRHFFAVAATAMRRILVDHARGRVADKRGGDRQRVTLDEPAVVGRDDLDQVLAVDQALSRLASLDERQAHIVELRFFVGLSEDEIGEVLGISQRTVKRDWRLARAWLQAQLSNTVDAGSPDTPNTSGASV